MKNVKKLFAWYWMFTKRLFRRYSFIFILLMIPISIPCVKMAMEQGNGVLTVALCSEDGNDALANEIMTKLASQDSIIRNVIYDSPEAAINALKGQEVDAVWVFKGDMQSRIDKYVISDTKEHLVDVMVTEYSIPVQVANEKLFAVLHPYISYSMFENFVYSEDAIPSSVPKETVREHYDRYDYEGSIIKFSRLDATDTEIKGENFLTAPIRGILLLIIVMCSIAAAMYFLNDMVEGRYDWLSYKKRMFPAFGSCLSATVVASVSVLIALFISGMSIGFMEIPIMLVYIFAVTGFSLVMCTIFRSPGKLGTSIPGLLIVMVIMCPIFFNVNFLGWFRWFLPPYYYLNAITRFDYILYMLIYSVCTHIIAYGLNILLNRKERRPSLVE